MYGGRDVPPANVRLPATDLQAGHRKCIGALTFPASRLTPARCFRPHSKMNWQVMEALAHEEYDPRNGAIAAERNAVDVPASFSELRPATVVTDNTVALLYI